MTSLLRSLVLLAALVSAAAAQGWTERGGQASAVQLAGSIATATTGTYAIDKKGSLVVWNAPAKKWDVDTSAPATVGTPATTVATTCSGDVWLHLRNTPASASFRVRKHLSGTWRVFEAAVPLGVTFSSFAIGKDERDLWAVDTNADTWRLNSTSQAFDKMDAKLKSIAVGCTPGHVTVMGISTGGNLWRYVPADGKWAEEAQKVTGVAIGGKRIYVLDDKKDLYQFTPVAVQTSGSRFKAANIKLDALAMDGDDDLWGVIGGKAYEYAQVGGESNASSDADDSDADVVDRPDAEDERWQLVPGSAEIVQVATGGRGKLFGLTKDGEVKHFSKKNPNEWRSIPAPKVFKSISVSCDGMVVAVTGDNEAFRHNKGGSWVLLGKNLKAASVGSDEEEIWAVNELDNLVRYATKDGRFGSAHNGQLKTIDAGCDSSVWGVSREGNLWSRRMGQRSWAKRGDGVSSVSVGKDVMVLGKHQHLWRYEPPVSSDGIEGKVSWTSMNKRLKQVAANADGQVFGIDMSGRVVRLLAPAGRKLRDANWKPVQGRLEAVAVGSRENVYGLLKNEVQHFDPEAEEWTVLPSLKVNEISVGCDGTVWAMRDAGAVFRLQDKSVGWEKIPGADNVAHVAAGRRGHAWGLSKTGQPLEWNEKKRGWTPHQGDLVSIDTNCSGKVVGVDKTGKLWQYDRTTGMWSQKAENVVQVALGKHLYIIKADGSLHKQVQGDQWRDIGNAATVSTGDDGETWALDKHGRPWIVRQIRYMNAPAWKAPVEQKRYPVPEAPEASWGEPDGAKRSPFQPGEEPYAGKYDAQATELEVGRLMGKFAPAGTKVDQNPKPVFYQENDRPKIEVQQADPQDFISSSNNDEAHGTDSGKGDPVLMAQK